METISGHEAIARMRQLKHDDKTCFEMHHLTYNSATGITKGLRVVKKARLRPSLPEDKFLLDSDLYLPYTDLELHEPRMCFKILIRYVAFPPDFKLKKVNFFKK
jgi:hypothetical protein